MLDLNLGLKPQNDDVAPSPHVREATTQTFERDVLQKSMEVPVLVDFWAPWCGPCRQMMPVLEKAVHAAGGAVHMVKVDIDQSPDLAQAMRIQSVPAVYAFHQGKPVNGFMGAQPESVIRDFVARLAALGGGQKDDVPSAAATVPHLMNEGDAFFRAADYMAAMGRYGTALDADPAHTAALGAIGWCLYMTGDIEAVREMVEQTDEEQRRDPRLAGLAFVLAQGGEEPARKEGAEGQYKLAMARLAAADLAGAIDALVESVRLNRAWEDEKARKLLLGLFEAMATHHPLTAQGRRKLSSVLFS